MLPGDIMKKITIKLMVPGDIIKKNYNKIDASMRHNKKKWE